MGLLGGIINLVANFINVLGNLVPGINPDSGGKLSESVALLNKFLAKANTIFPLDTVSKILSLMIGIYIGLLTFYFVTRAINLLRGSG